MDIMIPYLGQITRLKVESKGAFHIAGLKDSNVAKLEREKRKKSAYVRNKMVNKTASKSDGKKDVLDEEDAKHLDTWA